MSDFVDKYKLVTAQNNWGAVVLPFSELYSAKEESLKTLKEYLIGIMWEWACVLNRGCLNLLKLIHCRTSKIQKTFIHWCPCVTRLGKKKLYPRIGPGHRKLERANRPPPAAKGSDCSEGIRRRLSNLRHLTRFWSL